MRILIAVDGSKTALDAVSWLVAHAGWYRGRPSVELVTVHNPVSRLAQSVMRIKPRELSHWYRKQGEANLKAARARLKRAGIAHRAKILVGPVAETIVRHARRAKCDLIVIGSSGMGAAGNLLATSVATKVLHRARLPVLLAR